MSNLFSSHPGWKTLTVGCGCLAALLMPVGAQAAGVTDPAGDFIPSYTGPHNTDLDVVSANVTFNGSSFTFTSTQAGANGQTPTALYVWGIDRGAGTSGFPTIAPGVLFDSVFVINPSGTSVVVDIANNKTTPISAIMLQGSTVTGTVPLGDLPSLGLSAADYLVNLWPRSGQGGLGVIADFAPDNSDFKVTATPEPATLSLLGISLLGGSLLLKRKRTRS